MNRASVYVGLLACAGAALALRLPGLADRPMHTDEAVHAVRFAEFWQTGRYQYDPHDYHGPTLYYVTFPFVWLSGAGNFADTSEVVYRLAPVCFGVGLILLLALLVQGLGITAVLSAAVLTAVSPALVYYSRYYIQETLLVCFTLPALGAVWRLLCAGRIFWAILLGVAGGLMHATKETCLLVWAAAACAAVLTALWERRRRLPSWRVLLVALVGGGLVSTACFSVGFTNWSGVRDAWLAPWHYLERAQSGLHIHAWYYYLSLLSWSHFSGAPTWTHGFILALAAVGMVAGVRRKLPAPLDSRLVRFLALYTVALGVAYSSIPYKTPWCVLGFLHGLILLAGVGAAVLWNAVRGRSLRVPLLVVGLAGVGHLAWQARLATSAYAARPENPLAYAHPVPDVVELGSWAERLASAHPDGPRMLTKVVMPHSWPLPWYLRRLERVGYWEAPPEDADAPLVIAATDLLPELQKRWRGEYQVFYYGVRAHETVAACVATPVYEAFRDRMTPTRAASP